MITDNPGNIKTANYTYVLAVAFYVNGLIGSCNPQTGIVTWVN